jgi:hypothetical protein
MTDKSTAEEQPAEQPSEEGKTEESLRDALERNFNESTKEEEPEEKSEEAEGSEEKSEEPEEKPDTSQDGEQNIEEEKQDADSVTAPQHWPEEHRQTFSSLPKEQQDFVLSRVKETEADYTRKTQSIAEQRKSYEALDQVLQPYQQQFAQSGITTAEAVARLLNAHNALSQRPKETLQKLALQYGVNLTGDEEDFADPQIIEQDGRFQKTEQAVNQLSGTIGEMQQQQLQAQVDAFEQSRNDDGTLKHPHFTQVREQMGRLMAADQSLTMEKAYADAVWTVPDVRQTLLEETKQKTARESLQKQNRAGKEKAVKAEKASKTVSPSSDNIPSDLSDLPLREHLAATYRRLEGN